MKQFTSLLCIGLVASIFAIASIGRAAGPAPTPPPKRTVIASISSDAITVDTGRNTKTFKIDKHTQFFYQGSRATLDELKPGMRVSVTPAFDIKTAASINASDAPTVPPPPAAPKK